MSLWRRTAAFWRQYGAWVLAVAFVVLFYALMARRHDAFRTRALDLAKFDQAIWNTLHGRFLFSTLESQSILGNHFSPSMALLSPVFLVWSDVRALFLVQTVGMAVAGLLLHRIVRHEHPDLALWFLLAFYLNPALHEITLDEFRRVTLAVPFLALALYALYVRKRWLMVAGLTLALLCKENVALVVMMVGIYLVLFERDWRWGVPLAALGAAWAVIVTLWVIPALGAPGDGSPLYPQLNYFGLSGDSYQDILRGILRDPWIFGRRMFDLDGLRAIGRILLPVGFVLPFLAADWLLMVVPSVAYMLMSTAPGMHRLEDWYMASVLPGLFAAVAVGLTRRPKQWARRLTVVLVCSSVVGYVLYSHAPGGGRFEPALYAIDQHQRLASQAVAAVPREVRVAAQDPYVPHLSHREHIYLYPWISIGVENVDYVVLDRNAHPYPFQPHEMEAKIDDLIADPRYTIEWEADGIFVFRRGSEPLPAFEVDAVADSSMRLDRVEVAPSDGDGAFQPVAQEPIDLEPGQRVRVSLYWEALTAPQAERTVSVRIADSSGGLVAIYDNLPGQGKKPTSWWQEGWEIRDVYYLTISPQAQLGPGSLSVLVYDSLSGETLAFDDGREAVTVCEVSLQQSDR